MDKVVSTVNFEGEVYIFTERGQVYRMYKDFSGFITFQVITTLRLDH
jgi:hypothetical protein